MKPFVQEIKGLDPVGAFLAVKHLPYSLLLDSADRKHPAGRYSFIACHPIETIEVKNGSAHITNWEQRLSFRHADPLGLIRERMESWIKDVETIPDLPPFQGGAAGMMGYDLGRSYEKLPQTAKSFSNVQDVAVGIYDQVLAFDHNVNKAWIFTHARNETEAGAKREFLLGLLRRRYELPDYRAVFLSWASNFDAEGYKENVAKVINYIRAGDIFQANISQRFTAELPEGFDPYVHYLQMRNVSPAPFGAYFNAGVVKISSASPERFLTLRERNVETRPIKGTRPRSGDATLDQEYRDALSASAKDRAENTMIVDLLRNDLSRVCTPESVEVPSLCSVESFSGVHHLVSVVRGVLKEGKDAFDLLRACFPGGSITGAPKIRAMEIIEEIEKSRRGAYCGSIGYIGFDGAMDTNILIRTLVYEGGKVSLQVGGGVVADSSPDGEYQETFDKASAILNSFEVDQQVERNIYAEAS